MTMVDGINGQSDEVDVFADDFRNQIGVIACHN